MPCVVVVALAVRVVWSLCDDFVVVSVVDLDACVLPPLVAVVVDFVVVFGDDLVGVELTLIFVVLVVVVEVVGVVVLVGVVVT